MESATTRGITVQVESRYEKAASKPSLGRFVHSYMVRIQNDSDHTIQLLRRHWYIADSDTTMREVDGEGVIGQQPILRPGEGFSYTSWSPLTTAIGKMSGTYLMMYTHTEERFEIEIPEFKLIAEFVLN